MMDGKAAAREISEPAAGNAPRMLVFTGDGKGKTTAALGMAVRAAGHGMAVKIIQFIKADASTGELAAFAMLPTVAIHQTGKGFVPPPDRPAFACHREAAAAGLRMATEALCGGRYGLVVLDEICTAVDRGLLAEADVVAALKAACADTVVALTGRGATAGLITLADTVTEMHCIKHGARAGWPARKGVEL